MYTDSETAPKEWCVRYVECSRCWALYMNPMLSDFGFSVLFDEAEQSYGATDSRAGEQVAYLTDQGLLNPGSILLDVGCYDGQFLANLPNGLTKIGIDIDATAIDRARKLLAGQDAELIVGDFETFTVDRSPDTIVMEHVLEHLPRPTEVLAKLHKIAHSGTRLLVEVPIVENGTTNDIVGFFSVHHMTSFSRASLRNCLARAGWEPIEWTEKDDYNGCRVLAAPAAPSPTIEGDPHDVPTTLATLNSWNDAAISVWRILAEVSSDHCLIWGGGAHTEFLYQRTPFFQSSPSRKYAIIDSDPRKQGRTWRGIPIVAPESVRDTLDIVEIPLVTSSYQDQEAMVGAAVAIGIAEADIFRLYDEISVH